MFDWLSNGAKAAALAAATLLALALGVGLRLSHRGAAARVASLERANAELGAALAEKTEAEEARARNAAEFRADFEWAAVGKVHYHPTTGAILRANRAHAAMLGYEPEELAGRFENEFTHPEDRNPEPYRRLLAGEIAEYAREKRYVRRDGGVVWVRVSASMVRDPETQAPLLAVAVVEDVDDRYRAQLALQQAKAELERVVDERTAALAQRDVLLREVYHRVKNNLQVVDSLLLLQSRRLVDGEAKAALEALRGRVHALGLVHHQLMGSADLETFDIGPFLEELMQHLLEGRGRNGVMMRVRAAPISVGLDFAIPLGLLVTELVTNSMKHAFDDGAGGSITVSLDDTGGGRLMLSVADDGRGYDPGAEVKGASLGASIIDGLVRQLRGELQVTGAEGTRTVVRLPAPEAAS